ncbi:MAG: CRISPR-associated protein Cas5 [candidate division WOR-3 bacterium]
MQVLEIRARGPVFSFRRPMDHNYQKTFNLPPPTTLLGLAGAALGLSPDEMWESNSVIRLIKAVALSDGEVGTAKDLWKIMKVKVKKITERSIYTRELLFFARYTIYYAAANTDLLNTLQKAFEDPVYALSLGREDELVELTSVRITEALETSPEFTGTFVPVDLHTIPNDRVHLILDQEGSFPAPQSVKLPVSFQVQRGIRKPEPGKVIVFTFIPPGLKLRVEGLDAFQCDGRAFCFWP